MKHVNIFESYEIKNNYYHRDKDIEPDFVYELYGNIKLDIKSNPKLRIIYYNDSDSDSSLTKLFNVAGAFNRMEIDGVEVDINSTGMYELSKFENHTVIYTLKDKTTIPDNLFFDCYEIEAIYIQNGVVTIGNNAFNSTYASTITIPNTVTTINDGAFANCDITSITIPDSVTTIGNSVFYRNPNLETITFTSETPPSVGTNTFPMDNGNIIHTPFDQPSNNSYIEAWPEYLSIIYTVK